MSPEGFRQPFSPEEEEKKESDQESLEEVSDKKELKEDYRDVDPTKGQSVSTPRERLSEERLRQLEKMKEKREKKNEE